MPIKKGSVLQNEVNNGQNSNHDKSSNGKNACSTGACVANNTNDAAQKNGAAVKKNGRPEEQATKRSTATRLTVRYDVGFGNQIFIRGEGANLNWNKGQLLHNRKNDEWVWETDLPFNKCEFKILINDEIFELGENHTINQGSTESLTPRF